MFRRLRSNASPPSFRSSNKCVHAAFLSALDAFAEVVATRTAIPPRPEDD